MAQLPPNKIHTNIVERISKFDDLPSSALLNISEIKALAGRTTKLIPVIINKLFSIHLFIHPLSIGRPTYLFHLNLN